MNNAGDSESNMAFPNTERPVRETSVALPMGRVPFLDNVHTTRKARALLMYSSPSEMEVSPTEIMCGADVLIFMHGFSQHPRNYRTLLYSLVQDHEHRYVIIAPVVSISDVLLPWQRVETTNTWASLASKLQSVVVVDAARATQLAFEAGASRIHILGHSLGGMAALALAAQAPSAFSSVIALAPAVHPSVNTHVNQMVTSEAFANGLHEFCARTKTLPILLVHGENDGIVRASESQEVFHAISNHADRAVSIFAMIHNGTHIGMEDCLKVHVHVPPLNLITKAVFALVDFFLFHKDRSQRSVQLPATLCLMRAWLTASPRARTDPHGVVLSVARAADSHNVTLSSRPSLTRRANIGGDRYDRGVAASSPDGRI